MLWSVYVLFLSVKQYFIFLYQATAVVRLSKLPAFKELQAYIQMNRKVR